MTAVRIVPGPLRGSVPAPPSKSYTHRALVLGHLRGAPFRIERPLDADDTRATARGVAALGSAVEFGRSRWTVAPGPAPRRRRTIRCGASGSTLRFLAPVAAVGAAPVRFTGDPRLGGRPMEPLLAALVRLGATVERPVGGGWPIAIRGPIHAGRVRLDASASSQFLSGLLLALPAVAGTSRIDLVGRRVSAPYVAATLAVLRAGGIRVAGGDRSFTLSGPQRFRSDRFRVPGDASGAAYLWAGAALTGGRVTVRGLDLRWPQADLAILPLLRRYGATVRRSENAVTVAGGPRRPFSIDLTDAPDLYPLAGVLAAAAPGPSRLAGAAHVVHKESDRRAGTARLVRALGARVRTGPGGALEITGRGQLRAVALGDLTDHRMLMSAAVAALAADGPSRLGPRPAVTKSFPGFWRTLADLGVTDGRS